MWASISSPAALDGAGERTPAREKQRATSVACVEAAQRLSATSRTSGAVLAGDDDGETTSTFPRVVTRLSASPRGAWTAAPSPARPSRAAVCPARPAASPAAQSGPRLVPGSTTVHSPVQPPASSSAFNCASMAMASSRAFVNEGSSCRSASNRLPRT